MHKRIYALIVLIAIILSLVSIAGADMLNAEPGSIQESSLRSLKTNSAY